MAKSMFSLGAPWQFLIVSAAAAYCIFGRQSQSGWMDMMAEWAEKKPDVLPGGGEARTVFVGWEPLDQMLATLVRSFWPMVAGEIPAATIFSFWSAGQILPVQALIMLEGLRPGNRGRLISYTTIFGLIFQTIPFGIVMPLWIMLYLWTSPIAKVSAGTSAASDKALATQLDVDDVELSVLPHSLILGYILPTILMSMPSPAFLTVDQQQIFVAIWQAFPLWCGLLQFVLARFSRLLGAEGRMASLTEKERAAAHAKRFRWVYIFAVAVAGFTHSLTLGMITFGTIRAGKPAEVALPFFGHALDGVTMSSVFVPASPLGVAKKATSIGQGMFALLHWDMYLGIGVVVALASQLFTAVTETPSMLGRLCAFTGPGGAALMLVWRRDEKVLLRQAEDAGKKKE